MKSHMQKLTKQVTTTNYKTSCVLFRKKIALIKKTYMFTVYKQIIKELVPCCLAEKGRLCEVSALNRNLP